MFKQSTSFTSDFQPGPHDVICAKSNSAFQHFGNRRFRLLLEFHAKAYEAAKTKAGKKEVFLSIFSAIQSSGGRFTAESCTMEPTQTAKNDLWEESSLIASNPQDEALSLADNLHHALMVDDDEPSATTKQQEDLNTEPLPITSSDFISHRSSLVGMLLSPSFFRESVKNTARRCSTALTCMLRNSMMLKVPEDDHASLLLADLDGDSVLSSNDGNLSIDFEDIVAFDE